jgi:hypothetical protein
MAEEEEEGVLIPGTRDNVRDEVKKKRIVQVEGLAREELFLELRLKLLK